MELYEDVVAQSSWREHQGDSCALELSYHGDVMDTTPDGATDAHRPRITNQNILFDMILSNWVTYTNSHVEQWKFKVET